MNYDRNLSRSDAQAPKGSNRKAPSGSGTFPAAGKKQTVFLCILLAGATIALYSPVVKNSFVALDDSDYITANPHVQSGLKWSTVKWAFTSTQSANWHPLTWLSHALDCQLFGVKPAGHHLDSVLLHALNAVLLFLLLAWGTKRVWPSLLVAALFAVHPLNVESVAWAAERKTVLSVLFFFLAIGAYAWYVRKPEWRRYLLVAALFGMGLMAKPMVITLPFVLLLLDYWPLERMSLGGVQDSAEDGPSRIGFSKLAIEKVPLLALSIASAWITLKVQRSGQGLRSLQQYSLGVRIENAIVSYVRYVEKALWPARLAVLYPHPGAGLPAWQWVLSALALIVVTVFVVHFRSRRYLPVGWFWFIGTLFPVIGLVQVGEASMADRYAYIPVLGIFTMIVWGFADWADSRRLGGVWRLVPALCVVAALSAVTIRQLGYWKNEYTMWAHTLQVTDHNPIAQDSMAEAILNPALASSAAELSGLDTPQKRVEEARSHYEQALGIRKELAQKNPDANLPHMAMSLNDLGVVAGMENRKDEARKDYEEALKIYRQLAQQDPAAYLGDIASTETNLGNLDYQENRPEEARQLYEDVLKIYRQLAQQNPDIYLPNLATTLNGLGILNATQNQPNEAGQHFVEALAIYRQLAQKDPERYRPYLLGTVNYLRVLERTTAAAKNPPSSVPPSAKKP
ncbi:MAG: tetratricopeptide repeat protein [Terriglobales bacterium]|jgi:tetratricopeptide (TPR) repeat protein